MPQSLKKVLPIITLILALAFTLGASCGNTGDRPEDEAVSGLVFPDYLPPEEVSIVLRDEGTPETIYACAKSSPEQFTGVIKSTDNGESWQKIYEAENDVINFAISDKNLFLVVVSRYGGGSGEIFIKIATSEDEGVNWSLSEEIAKNDTTKLEEKQPFISRSISDLIVDQEEPSKSYILYKDNFDSESFDKMIYTKDFWETWGRKDL